MQKDKDAVLVYVTQPTESNQDDFPSVFGGLPTWLVDPCLPQLSCSHCKVPLTFLFQLYTPLPLAHSYHRVLYLFFCEKCWTTKRGFHIYRQQLPDQPIKPVEKPPVCSRLEEEYAIQTEVMQAEEYRRVVRRAQTEVDEDGEDEEGMQEVEEDDEEDEQEQGETEGGTGKKNSGKIANKMMDDGSGQEDDIELKPRPGQAPADPLFQLYKKVTQQLQYPIAIYFPQPLFFKSPPPNLSQKRCGHCKSPLHLQLQLNSTILNKFSRLAFADIGVLFILTCTQSCKAQSKPFIEQECELQVEDESVAALQFELEKKEAEELKKEKKREKRKEKRRRKKEEKAEDQLEEEDKKEDVDDQGDWD